MYKMIAEQPIFSTVLLGILAAAFLYIWSRGAPRARAIIGLVFLLCIPLVWIGSVVIETDEEQLRKVIRSIAREVQENDFQGVYEIIHPDYPEIRRRAQAELPNYTFSVARVATFRRLRVVDAQGAEPRRAVADLNAAVRVTVNNAGIRDQAVLRRLFLLFEEAPDGWKVIDYAHQPPVGPSDPYTRGGNTPWEDWFKQ